MYGWYPERFEREMGCTEDELLRWLPGALEGATLHPGTGVVRAEFPAGRVTLAWQPLSPRRIALLAMPRMRVSFNFDAMDDAARQRVMRRFDLYTQRGGG